MTTYEGGNLAGLQQKLTEFSTAVNPPLAPEGNSLSFSLALHPSLSTFSSSISYFSSPAPVGGPQHSLTLLQAPLPHFLLFTLTCDHTYIPLFSCSLSFYFRPSTDHRTAERAERHSEVPLNQGDRGSDSSNHQKAARVALSKPPSRPRSYPTPLHSYARS